MERRAKLRISEPFPTTVSGVDSSGEPFQVECVLENISSTGIYLKLPHQLKEGSEVEMSLKLSSAASSGARAAIRGIALRSDPQADESIGVSCRYQRVLLSRMDDLIKISAVEDLSTSHLTKQFHGCKPSIPVAQVSTTSISAWVHRPPTLSAQDNDF